MRLNRYPVILAYHCVAPTPAPGTPTVTPAAFDRQIRFIARHAQVLTLREAVRAWLATGRWPRRSVAITFDDGDDTTYTHAWPILQHHHVPATVFMIAAHVGKPQSLSSTQLRELASGGIEIGSHTVHHAYLPSVSTARIRDELQSSKQALSDVIGAPVDTLSYPGGGFSPEAARRAIYRPRA